MDSQTIGNAHHRVDLEKDRAILRLACTVDMVDGNLYYGHGYDPYCNITDAASRSVPAFGPLPVRPSKPRAITPYINHVRISRILPFADVRKMAFPDDVELQAHQFEGAFCDRHLELGPAGEALVYYVFDFGCRRPMKLNLLLGYDGPVKVWLDRKVIFCDPRGTNPARPEDAVVPFAAGAGRHHMLVALGSHGAAWGVYLRLERTDVSKTVLRRNPQGVEMPEVLG